MARNMDMTQGPIMKRIVLFALPICAGNILQQLYNTVDTLVIGNFCGTQSLAAVGTSGQPVELLLCIFMGMGTGVSILVAQFTGSGNLAMTQKAVSTSISFLYICAIPLSVLGVLLSPLILGLMAVPEDVWEYCMSYLNIIFLGTLGNMGYNMNAGILRGLGNSRASLFFLLISCIVNVVLDLLFVAGFHMDVAGAALATSIAMFCSWFFSIFYIKKMYPELAFTWLPKHLDKSMMGQILKIGLPLGLNNSIYSIGHILLQTLINTQGAVFIAACSVGSRLTGMANVAINSFSSAATTFAGQNMGAKAYRRLHQGAKQIPFFSALFTAVAGLLLTIFCQPVLYLFTQENDVLAMATRYIQIVMPFTWFFAAFSAMLSFANGLGEVRYPTIVNILMLWVIRIPVAYLIGQWIGGTYIMACYPISFFCGMVGMLIFFLTPQWKRIPRQ